jgi:hypothetical protein
MAMEKTVASEQLLHRLDELERHVSRLEQPGESQAGKPTAQSPIQIDEEVTVSSFWVNRSADAAESESERAVVPATALESAGVGGVVSSVAKAVLGMAGAYLLRAGAESGWLPHSAAILMAFAYALTWLIAAGKSTSRGPACSTIYALASAIIFLGLAWENAVRSALLPPPLAAFLIVVYLWAGQLVAWLSDRREIAAATTASMVALSLVLFVTTHNLMPFNMALLCAAAVSEFAACRGRWLGQRWMAALAADFAIFITVWISSQSLTLPEGYTAYSQVGVMAIQLTLVLVYLASMAFRTLARQTVVTAFEMAQNLLAIGLFILGQVVMARASRQRLLAGVFCFIIAKGSYTVSILLARKRAEQNSFVYGVFGLALQITAILIVVPPYARVFAWCVLGVGAAWLGNRERQLGLRLQAPVYVFAAALASGLIQASSQSISNLVVPRIDHLAGILVTSAAAVLVCALDGSGHAGKKRIPQTDRCSFACRERAGPGCNHHQSSLRRSVTRDQLADRPDLPRSDWIGPVGHAERLTRNSTGVGLAFVPFDAVRSLANHRRGSAGRGCRGDSALIAVLRWFTVAVDTHLAVAASNLRFPRELALGCSRPDATGGPVLTSDRRALAGRAT